MAQCKGTGLLWILMGRYRTVTSRPSQARTRLCRYVSSSPPPGSWSSHLSRLPHRDLYRLSVRDADRFWGSAATDRLKWIEPFQRVQDCDLSRGQIRWFLGGKLNVSGEFLVNHRAVGSVRLKVKNSDVWHCTGTLDGDSGMSQRYR
ncbi:hypothetical protein ILYODFUR_028218 [Ilyodon furcidens]|uniref:Acetyl-coenzyme A synthetase N-terminal domain-containing protein n=1 Tax=Ilyodon furcidens TaxID=33524 RepID=A0ABV0TD27_9TELE